MIINKRLGPLIALIITLPMLLWACSGQLMAPPPISTGSPTQILSPSTTPPSTPTSILGAPTGTPDSPVTGSVNEPISEGSDPGG
jgi:hypothetical protein